MNSSFLFQVSHSDGVARRGQLTTPHGVIQTPIFMPVGTQGTVKSLGPDDLDTAGAQIILGNTYHLMLRPGAERMKRLGGLHKFMNWHKPILTDSGGFQVFSLAQGQPRGSHKNSGVSSDLVKIDDNGVTFRSYLDGSLHRTTPEDSMAIQMAIGADIIMAFDQCPPGQSGRGEVQSAINTTTRWLKRCMSSMTRSESRLFGIVQGGIYEDLRQSHARELTDLDLFGYAIGGLSVGEAKEDMWPALHAATSFLPTEKPRYLMGVGTPDDLLDGIARGVDMFDCVMPTRNARNGTLFTHFGKVSIKSARFQEDESALDEKCSCYTCRTFSKAYLRHLFVAKELLFYRLASLHNITYYLSLMHNARVAIENGCFTQFHKAHCDLTKSLIS